MKVGSLGIGLTDSPVGLFGPRWLQAAFLKSALEVFHSSPEGHAATATVSFAIEVKVPNKPVFFGEVNGCLDQTTGFAQSILAMRNAGVLGRREQYTRKASLRLLMRTRGLGPASLNHSKAGLMGLGSRQ